MLLTTRYYNQPRELSCCSGGERSGWRHGQVPHLMFLALKKTMPRSRVADFVFSMRCPEMMSPAAPIPEVNKMTTLCTLNSGRASLCSFHALQMVIVTRPQPRTCTFVVLPSAVSIQSGVVHVRGFPKHNSFADSHRHEANPLLIRGQSERSLGLSWCARLYKELAVVFPECLIGS